MKRCCSLPTTVTSLLGWLKAPVHGASLALFRIGFGLLMVFALLRFWARGWLQAYYLQPQFHFTYWGFDWVQPWSAWGMNLHLGVLIAAALAIALGWHYRLACGVFFLGFSWLELLDKTPYLNHYYAISLFAFLLLCLPLDHCFSWRQPGWQPLPRWCLLTLQVQVALIYFFAAVAKMQPDWLLAAEPLRRWLQGAGHLPVLGPWLLWRPLPWLMAWAGMLFDLLIPLVLLQTRLRLWAYGLLLFFHGFTAWLFPIGIFPFLMSFAALLFFPPDWPFRFFKQVAGSLPEQRFQRLKLIKGRGSPDACAAGLRLHRAVLLLLGLHFFLQLLLPWRYLLTPGSVLWHEQGFRFSWRVMLIEKTGWVEYRLISAQHQRQWRVSPGDYLTPFQLKMMSTQPDMILQFGQYLGQRWQARGYADIAVYADAYAALNGRPSQRLIDPDFNLLSWSRGAWGAPYVLPLEQPVPVATD